MDNWQDLEVGQAFETDTITLSKRDILEFAAEFDPVFAEDSLCANVVIADCKKDLGLLVCDIAVKNQHQKVALVLSMTLRVGAQSIGSKS